MGLIRMSDIFLRYWAWYALNWVGGLEVDWVQEGGEAFLVTRLGMKDAICALPAQTFPNLPLGHPRNSLR